MIEEHIHAFPFDRPPRVLHRQEELLLADPLPRPGRTFDFPLIEAVHFEPSYVPGPFGPPRGVYESDFIRVEWQTMNNRQGFYHRNCDVDEMSYQVCGERTLITELGSVEHRPGDFSRIPVSVAHDNFGREDIHLLFYVPAPVTELGEAVRESQAAFPPFPGWEPVITNELTTECLGGPEHHVVMAPTDERVLLEQVHRESDRIRVQRADRTAWLYRSADILLGKVVADSSDGLVYTRNRDADEVHYQISGHRTLVTQRGTLELEPGDFVRIPVGVAFTSIHDTRNEYLRLASARAIPQLAKATKQGVKGFTR
ncbi:hypothetical protein HII36_10055 [Nonomuraea sp. NN258]|uniref:hypothetical protein n=1 Tax=Nonomuraea antri TaxID=2730852 RepID=UPI001568079B|nr:hypothetical protein [Nonomuraea antri]NRQ32176.1 hypothetical protein [Nonomuraea antri]